MLRYLLPLSLLAACTPSPRKAAMPSPDPMSASSVPKSDEATPNAPNPAMQAALAPIPEPVSAAGVAAPRTPSPVPLADSPAAALGRQTLSTAFVRAGPGEHLTVERHDGRTLVLREVRMGPKKYCGVDGSGAQYCGNYAEVSAARPGDAPTSGQSKM